MRPLHDVARFVTGDLHLRRGHLVGAAERQPPDAAPGRRWPGRDVLFRSGCAPPGDVDVLQRRRAGERRSAPSASTMRSPTTWPTVASRRLTLTAMRLAGPLAVISNAGCSS